MAATASTVQWLAGRWRGYHDADPATLFNMDVVRYSHHPQTANVYFDSAPTTAVPATIPDDGSYYGHAWHLTLDL